MGLFQSKKRQNKRLQQQEAAHEVEHFFDEYFREELKNHGRWYFEKVISENGTLFKKDLDATLSELNTDLREHATKQLNDALQKIDSELKQYIVSRVDEQIASYTGATKEAQERALSELNSSTSGLQQRHRELTENLEKTTNEQAAMFKDVFEGTKGQLEEMKETQRKSLDMLKDSVEALQKQHQEISQTIQKNIEAQQEALMNAFQENMASVIEHHLLEALGDQYELKDQLPSIIKQMEETKQTIVDDMKI